MAWIRRVRTASGATAVQIAESVGGRRRIVRHVGSAHDEAELGLLMAQADKEIRARVQAAHGKRLREYRERFGLSRGGD